MAQNFNAGDFLVFQIEAGFALLRILAVDETEHDTVWHVSAFDEFFLEIDKAEQMIADGALPKPNAPHIALTNRAFESTQVSRLTNLPLTDDDLEPLSAWRTNGDREISDRSVRLMLGLR